MVFIFKEARRKYFGLLASFGLLSLKGHLMCKCFCYINKYLLLNSYLYMHCRLPFAWKAHSQFSSLKIMPQIKKVGEKQ